MCGGSRSHRVPRFAAALLALALVPACYVHERDRSPAVVAPDAPWPVVTVHDDRAWPFWFVRRSVAAVTLPGHIYLRPGAPIAPGTLAHEYAHAVQWADEGAMGFVLKQMADLWTMYVLHDGRGTLELQALHDGQLLRASVPDTLPRGVPWRLAGP